MADFRNHPSAGDGLLNHLGNPLAAADCPARALDADFLAATGIAGITDALFDNRTRDVTRFRHPFAGAAVDRFALRDRLADRVAHVLVAGLSFCLPACAAHLAMAGLIHRLADVVAHCPVAGLIDRLADRVAAFAVTGLIDRFADAAGDVAVAGFMDRLADVVSAGAIAGLIDRLADRVALVTVAGFVNVLCAGHRYGFRTLVVHGFHTGILLAFPDNFLHGMTLRTASAASCHEVTGW